MADTDVGQPDDAWFAAMRAASKPVEDNDQAAVVPIEWVTAKTLAEVFAFISAMKPHIAVGGYWDANNESK